MSGLHHDLCQNMPILSLLHTDEPAVRVPHHDRRVCQARRAVDQRSAANIYLFRATHDVAYPREAQSDAGPQAPLVHAVYRSKLNLFSAGAETAIRLRLQWQHLTGQRLRRRRPMPLWTDRSGMKIHSGQPQWSSSRWLQWYWMSLSV